MKRRLYVPLLLPLLLWLGGCLPVAEVARDLIEIDGGATLAYVSDGARFDPGDRASLGTVIVAESPTAITLGEGQPACEVQEEVVLVCRLGRVEAPVTVRYAGSNVIASAHYRRADSGSSLYLAFAR